MARPSTHAASPVLGNPPRAMLQSHLETATEPISVCGLARLLDLPPARAQFHVQALIRHGLAEEVDGGIVARRRDS